MWLRFLLLAGEGVGEPNASEGGPKPFESDHESLCCFFGVFLPLPDGPGDIDTSAAPAISSTSSSFSFFFGLLLGVLRPTTRPFALFAMPFAIEGAIGGFPPLAGDALARVGVLWPLFGVLCPSAIGVPSLDCISALA